MKSLTKIFLLLFTAVVSVGGFAVPTIPHKVKPGGPIGTFTRITLRAQQAGLTLPKEWSKGIETVTGALTQDRDRFQRRDSRRVLCKTLDAFTVEMIEQAWEGSTWVNREKTVITFDDSQQTALSWTTQVWEGGGWVNQSRMLSQLNASGQITEIRFEEWKGGTWVPTMALLSTYDASGNEVVLITQMDENEDGILENMMKSEMAYNASGQMTKETLFLWDSGSWTKLFETLYTYNGLGQLVEETSQMDFGGGFILFTNRTLYTYTASGLPETITEQEYDFSTSSWVNETRTRHEYNTAGETTRTTVQNWDGTQWVNASRYTATYQSPGGNLLEETNELADGGGWVFEDRYLYEYDAQGRNTIQVYQYWENGGWVNQERSIDTLNAEGLPTETLIQTWEGTAWTNASRYLYTYGGTSVSEQGNAIPASFTLHTYPNPFNPETTLQLILPGADRLVLQVVDVQGRVVRNLVTASLGPGVHSFQWDGKDDGHRNLPSGVYMIRATGLRYRAIGRCLLVR